MLLNEEWLFPFNFAIIKMLLTNKNMKPKKKNLKNIYSIPAPSFLEGLARLFDWSGSLNVYWRGNAKEYSDFSAIKNDWQAIGNDFKTAVALYGKQCVAK